MNPKVRQRLVHTLAGLYPNPASELIFKNPYELIVSVVLSAQCTDKKVNDTTPALFSKFPTFSELAKANIAEVEAIIRPINYYKTKAKNIVALSQRIEAEFQGQLPTTHSDLIDLPGVGNKTANVILCEQGKVPAFPVDTHVFRLAHRLGLSKGKTPEEVEEDLKQQFSSNLWRDLHHQLIFHGRRVCKAQSPLCKNCALAAVCPSRSN